MFTGESDSLEIKDYSFNKEKKYKVIHPEIVKEYAHLNSISKIAKDDTIVCFEKKLSNCRFISIELPFYLAC